jgi:N-acylneuraminate cytidylyltransferase
MNVGLIPARAGSTRILRKNLSLVGNASLLVRAIDCAHAAELHAVVSTDDNEIAAIAASLGCEVHMRPAALATSTAQIEPAIVHWIRSDPRRTDSVGVIALLQPTSPFRTPATVRACVDAVASGEYDSALTVHVDAHRTVFSGRIRGHRVVWERPAGHRPRTQDARDMAIENGCVYAFSRAHLLSTRSRMGGRERAVIIDDIEGFDVDTPEQLEIARAIAAVREGRAA